MDGLEMNLEERLGDKDGRKNSDDETEREVRTMFECYDMRLDDKKEYISPPKLELTSQFRPRLSPLHTMDISSVCYRPVPVMAQAELTSTYSHPRLELQEMGKVNSQSYIGIKLESNCYSYFTKCCDMLRTFYLITVNTNRPKL